MSVDSIETSNKFNVPKKLQNYILILQNYQRRRPLHHRLIAAAVPSVWAPGSSLSGLPTLAIEHLLSLILILYVSTFHLLQQQVSEDVAVGSKAKEIFY